MRMQIIICDIITRCEVRTMFCKNSIKRFLRKGFFVQDSYNVLKRQRSSTLLQNSQDRPEHRDCWKPILFIALVLPSIYFMFYYEAGATVFIPNIAIATEPGKADADEVKSIKSIKKPEKPNVQAKRTYKNTKFKRQKFPSKEKIQFRMMDSKLPWCNTTVSGEVNLNLEVNNSIILESLYPMVAMGGYYNPMDCRARHKVAILVPYRNSKENLWLFLYNIHPFLMRQNVEYQIFVFEQSGTYPFNKGRLFNAGFREINKNDDWQCIIFHDVNLLPTDGKTLYTCPVLPREMVSTIVEKNRTVTPQRDVFGGVTAMTMWQYRKVNGHSNLYWGTDSEDTIDKDMFKRIHVTGLGITRYKDYARYIALDDSENTRNTSRYEQEYPYSKTEERYKTDGLYNLRYRMEAYASRHLFTHVVIDVEPPVLPEYITEA